MILTSTQRNRVGDKSKKFYDRSAKKIFISIIAEISQQICDSPAKAQQHSPRSLQ